MAIVGDRWTVLILRELFSGCSRFNEIQAQTGATAQMLATRLKRLEADGSLVRAERLQPAASAARIQAHTNGARFLPYHISAPGLGRNLVQASTRTDRGSNDA
jgi:HxlR-like helix-turn-helix